MMYTVKNIMEDFEMVKAMLKVIDTVPNKERFTLADIGDFYKTHPYRTITNDRRYTYHDDYFYFKGASLKALVNRGLIEKIGEEDYIWEEEGYRGKIHKHVGTRNVYRVADVSFDTYKQTFANLIYLKIMTA